MTRKIRYGIIGCGKHALQSHAKPGLKVPELELVALCDPSQAQMEKFEEELGCTVTKYTNEADLYARTADLDAVVIASPDRFHAQSLFTAVKFGKHVMCEKPIATTEAELPELYHALGVAKNTGHIVTSCHPRRFDQPYRWLKSQLPHLKEEHGPVIALELDFSYHKPSKRGLHIGLLMDHLNHEYDLMTYLFGPELATAHRLVDTLTRYHVTGYRRDGIAFSFQGTRMLEAHRYPEYVRVRFARGALTVECQTGDAEILSHETGRVNLHAGPTDYADRFLRVMQNFAASMLKREQNYLKPDELLKNTAIGIALTENASWSG